MSIDEFSWEDLEHFLFSLKPKDSAQEAVLEELHRVYLCTTPLVDRSTKLPDMATLQTLRFYPIKPSKSGCAKFSQNVVAGFCSLSSLILHSGEVALNRESKSALSRALCSCLCNMRDYLPGFDELLPVALQSEVLLTIQTALGGEAQRTDKYTAQDSTMAPIITHQTFAIGDVDIYAVDVDPQLSSGLSIEAEQEQVICALCLEAKANTIFEPCGCLRCCDRCIRASGFKRCPFCSAVLSHSRLVDL